MQKRSLEVPKKLWPKIALGCLLAPGVVFAQSHLPAPLALSGSSLRLGEDVSSVRRELNVKAPLYQSPFHPFRLTLKAPQGTYVDFEHGKVVEIDYTSRAAGARLGDVGVGSSVADARAALGALTAESPATFLYTTAAGELVQLRVRAADQSIAVIAVVADKTHPFALNRPAKIILRNQ